MVRTGRAPPMNVAVSPLEVNADSEGCHPLFRDAPSSVEFNKLRKRLMRLTREAIENFAHGPARRALAGGAVGRQGFLRPARRCCSTSNGAACCRSTCSPATSTRASRTFRSTSCRNSSTATASRTASNTGTPIRSSPTRSPEGSTYCSLCSRLRRGHLYRIAREEGCSALVLGHHREDSLETFFMNLFHGGRLAAMPPKLLNDEGDVDGAAAADLSAPRPISRVRRRAWRFPIIPCDLCGSQEGLQRNAMKAMLDDIERRMPGRKDTMIRALGNVRPIHLLDRKLFDFAASVRSRRPRPMTPMRFDDRDRRTG